MQIRVPFASISLFAFLGTLAGCGDDISRQDGGTGGSIGGSSGGSNAGAGGNGGNGGNGGSVVGGNGGRGGVGGGGGSIGGSGGSTGGTGGGATGTAGATGGSGGRGGSGGSTGGSGGSTGGSGGSGGRGGSGGSTGGTGGGTGGTAGGTGGGGSTGTGGGGTGGGTGGTGGGTGGTGGGTGGTGGGTGGTGGMPACYTVAFTAPTNGATLTVADDTNMTCADGFRTVVRITTNAPDGTVVQLFNNGTTLLLASTVASGAASFDVQLPATAQSALSIQFPSTAPCTDPTTQSTVTVNCPNTAPTCTISKPTITATHIALNGVLESAGGDRASQVGSPYQVTFTVTTNAEDGQPVTLSFNDAASPAVVMTLNATASSGSATFPVPLSPDGTYQVNATCKNANNVTTTSTLTSFPVDTTPPVLTVSAPTDGKFFGPTELSSGQFNVCAQTPSADAAGLPASLGAAANNLCVALGGSTTCVGTAAVTAVNTDACVPVTCPGAAPFDITVTLKDGAGNPTAKTITNVSCASALPSVQVIQPVSDAPAFNDPSKHILSASAPVGVRDLDANAPGAQADVVACTDRIGSATLETGLKGGTLTVLAGPITTVAASATDNCPSGLGFVARFSGVTLPESAENANGTLLTPTELVVRVADAINPASIGPSGPVDLWVDSVAPVLGLQSPLDLCGSFQQASGTFVQSVAFTAETAAVVLQVTNGATTATYDTPTFTTGTATFANINFNPGQNDVTATETDPAGNRTTFATVPCSVTVGSAPVVQFTTPTTNQVLCPNGSTAACVKDVDAATADWQGAITVLVTGDGQPLANGGTVTFTYTVGAGAPVALGNGAVTIDGSGKASIPVATLPEGAITLTATTNNITNRGVGTGTATVTVDLTPPGAPTALTVSVTDRRRTTMHLAWTAPADGGARVGSYDVRYAKVPITAANFDDTTVTAAMAYAPATPSSPGAADGIDVTPLFIETDYFFAVRATDAAGNVSAVVPTAAATRASFITTVLNGMGTDGLGQETDGSGDFGDASTLSFTPDGFSDLIVGNTGGTSVYIYFGSATGYAATPSIKITGATANFGQSAINAGDLDGDGLNDIAVASPSEGGGKIYIYSRKNPPASWGATNTWPATLADTQANYVLTVDATFAGGAGSIQPGGLARIGNFDGTGSDDLAVGLLFSNATDGVLLVVKGSAALASAAIPSANTIEFDGVVPAGFFGWPIVGIGSFFSPATGPTFITGSAPANVYAFRGQSPAGVVNAANADDSTIGSAADVYGLTLGYLGPLGGSPAALAISGVFGIPAYVDVHLGTAATGPFQGAAGGAPAAAVRFIDSASGNSFGILNLGGGVKGTSQVLSLIGGDTTSDLVLAGYAETGTPIYIVNGALIPSLSGSVDVAAISSQSPLVPPVIKISGQIPSGWTGYGGSSVIPDADKDGYPDFAVGEFAPNKAGRVVIFR